MSARSGGFGVGGSAAGFGLRWLERQTADIQQSIERLSTGKRINRASDDPAGAVVCRSSTTNWSPSSGA